MRGKKSLVNKRHDSLHKTYLRAYRKKIENQMLDEDIIQTAKFNLKLESMKLPAKKREQLSLMDLINAANLQ
jgi:hypothetical protein